MIVERDQNKTILRLLVICKVVMQVCQGSMQETETTLGIFSRRCDAGNWLLRNKRTRGTRIRGAPLELLDVRTHHCSRNLGVWKPQLPPP